VRNRASPAAGRNFPTCFTLARNRSSPATGDEVVKFSEAAPQFKEFSKQQEEIDDLDNQSTELERSGSTAAIHPHGGKRRGAGAVNLPKVPRGRFRTGTSGCSTAESGGGWGRRGNEPPFTPARERDGGMKAMASSFVASPRARAQHEIAVFLFRRIDETPRRSSAEMAGDDSADPLIAVDEGVIGHKMNRYAPAIEARSG